MLALIDPDAHHAVSLFSEAATGRLDFWYIDLIGPAQRRHFGFDFIEHGLNIVVEPDLARWSWKDHDELEWAVSDGRYSRAEADGLYREGERAVESHLRAWWRVAAIRPTRGVLIWARPST